MCFVDKLSVFRGELVNFYNTVRKIWDQNVSGYLTIQTMKTSANHIKKTGALPRREVLPGNDQSTPISKGQYWLLHFQTVRVESARGAQWPQTPVLQVQQTRTSSRFWTVWQKLNQGSGKKSEAWQKETEAIGIPKCYLVLSSLCQWEAEFFDFFF